jgi:HTH-type transcriptional regulator / antitoxin HipB
MGRKRRTGRRKREAEKAMRLRTPEELGVLVREKRRALKLSQSAVAKPAGTSREWIVDLEKGKPRVQLSLVLRTLVVLGIAIETQDEERKPRKARAQRAAVDIDQILKKFRRRK